MSWEGVRLGKGHDDNCQTDKDASSIREQLNWHISSFHQNSNLSNIDESSLFPLCSKRRDYYLSAGVRTVE